MDFLVVDRIEGASAVVEWRGRFYRVRRGALREGQVFRPTRAGWRRDRAEERRRLAAARAELERMRATDPGGNITL